MKFYIKTKQKKQMRKTSLLIIAVISTVYSAMAQLTPMKTQYFQNQYLTNPAMAAKDNQTSIFTNYSSQWGEIEGGPKMLSLSASTPLTDRAAVGVNIISDKAGLLKRTQTLSSFAYKLPLNDDHDIRVGISLSWTEDKIDNSTATSNGTGDPALMGYNNNRENHWDGNFGIAYVSEKFEAQFTYLNLNQKRSQVFSTVDYSTFYSALAYKFNLDNNFTIKPLIAYRGVNGYTNQWDIAAEWGAFSKDFNLYTMYHSNKSFSGGFGYEYDHKLIFSGFYSSEPSAIRGFTGGIFDVAIGYKF
jgi:type IX secretion system PorP/SprF family membrane protein